MEPPTEEVLWTKLRTLSVLTAYLAELAMRSATTEEDKVLAFKTLDLAVRVGDFEWAPKEMSNDQ